VTAGDPVDRRSIDQFPDHGFRRSDRPSLCRGVDSFDRTSSQHSQPSSPCAHTEPRSADGRWSRLPTTVSRHSHRVVEYGSRWSRRSSFQLACSDCGERSSIRRIGDGSDPSYRAHGCVLSKEPRSPRTPARQFHSDRLIPTLKDNSSPPTLGGSVHRVLTHPLLPVAATASGSLSPYRSSGGPNG